MALHGKTLSEIEQRDKARKRVIRAMHLHDEGDHVTLFNRGWDARGEYEGEQQIAVIPLAKGHSVEVKLPHQK